MLVDWVYTSVIYWNLKICARGFSWVTLFGYQPCSPSWVQCPGNHRRNHRTIKVGIDIKIIYSSLILLPPYTLTMSLSTASVLPWTPQRTVILSRPWAAFASALPLLLRKSQKRKSQKVWEILPRVPREAWPASATKEGTQHPSEWVLPSGIQKLLKSPECFSPCQRSRLLLDWNLLLM